MTLNGHMFSHYQTVILKTSNALDKEKAQDNVSTLHQSCY